MLHTSRIRSLIGLSLAGAALTVGSSARAQSLTLSGLTTSLSAPLVAGTGSSFFELSSDSIPASSVSDESSPPIAGVITSNIGPIAPEPNAFALLASAGLPAFGIAAIRLRQRKA